MEDVASLVSVGLAVNVEVFELVTDGVREDGIGCGESLGLQGVVTQCGEGGERGTEIATREIFHDDHGTRLGRIGLGTIEIDRSSRCRQ